MITPTIDITLKPVVDAIRILSMDAVQQANSGHPGMPMGMADAAAVLWSAYLKFDPHAPEWPDRDRFVLSAGHGSMLLYSLLHLSGFDLPLEALRNFRQWESGTPGHPEYGETVGVETTTGPLGQGIANGVGLALAERWLATRFNRTGFPVVDHFTYVVAGDGDLMEGISHEACALAGHLGLGRLIVLYDDNGITIDGGTELTFTEDVAARFEAYGWHVERVDGHDPTAVARALDGARGVEDRPSLIACRTTIGYGSPNRAGTAKAHGEPLGRDEVALTRAALGLDPAPFAVEPEGYRLLGVAGRRGAERHRQWREMVAAYEEAYPAEAATFRRTMAGELPRGWDEVELPGFDRPVATRAASGHILNAYARAIPELLGGSADLSGSNKTALDGAADVQRNAFGGRYLRFGVREHGMGAIMNGMALHGGIIPYGGTFLVFSDYMRPAIRMAALMRLGAIYVFTHDSIGLGEDGPTHQPVEHLASLRAMPNLAVFRPADAHETAAGWQLALANRRRPTVLALTRQKVPLLDPAVVEGARRGGYVVADADPVAVILMATGSEVHIALEARARLAERGIGARVVSLPCWEEFLAQPAAYRDQVLPPAIRARVAVEAAVTFGWERFVGSEGVVVGLDRFGASAPYQELYRAFRLTPEAVADAAVRLAG